MSEMLPGLHELARTLETKAAMLAQAVAESPNHLDVVSRAHQVDQVAAQLLKLCVQQSRAAGHTWQELGDRLGITRQAAFQRFGKPIDPRTGELMDKTIRVIDAGPRAREITAAILDDRLDDAQPSFNTQVLEAFTEEVRGNALATVAGLVGAFEGFGSDEPFVRQIADHTVVDIPLRYEAGEMKARVAFDTDAKVAGFFILPTEAP